MINDGNIHLIGATPTVTTKRGAGGRSLDVGDVGGIRWRPESSTNALDVTQAVARRLAVCWNVCRGYRTADIEDGVMRDGYDMAVELAQAVLAGRPIDAHELATRFRAHHDKMFHAFDVSVDDFEERACADDTDLENALDGLCQIHDVLMELDQGGNGHQLALTKIEALLVEDRAGNELESALLEVATADVGRLTFANEVLTQENCRMLRELNAIRAAAERAVGK